MLVICNTFKSKEKLLTIEISYTTISKYKLKTLPTKKIKLTVFSLNKISKKYFYKTQTF